MAGSINRATILGHLGADPEIHRTRDGKAIASFRVATTESWRDRNTGERKEKSEWHTVKVFNEGIAGVAEKYLRKGSKVLIEGQLQTRQWEKDGQKHYTTEIVLQGFQAQLIMLDGKEDGGGGRRNDRDDRDYDRDDRRDSRRDEDRGRSRSDDYRGGDSLSDRQRSSQRNDIDDQDIPF